MPKFQAIQAANEVLGEPVSKQKYDTDRRKAGLYPLGQTFNPRQPAPGNPYAANSAYPPPPRRTQPAAYQRPPPTPGTAPGPTANGADRFSYFPRPSPTARKDPAQDRTNMFKAWQNMNTTQERPRNFVPPGAQPPPQAQPQPSPQATRARPQPPPRPETKFPPFDQTRAGTKYRNVPPPFDAEDAEKRQSAWAAFQRANVGKPGVAPQPSAKTPRRQGFNPNTPGSDEKPADSNYFHRNQSESLGRGKPSVNVHGPTSAPRPGATSTAPVSPVSPKDQRPTPDPTRPFSSRTPNDQAPFAEGHRDRTPYTSFLRERTDIGAGLHRSFSTRDTTKLNPDSANRSRARSTSPLGRQRPDSQTKDKASQKAFDLEYSSSEMSDSDPSRTQTPEDANGSTASEGPHRPGTAPNTSNPHERPKKVPTPPSSRFNGTRSGPTSPPPMPQMPRMNRATDGAQSDNERPSMQQRSGPNMYADLSPSSSSSFNSQPSTTWTSGSSSQPRARRTWSNIGPWAIPSSLNPVLRAQPQSTSYVTAADEVFKNATKNEQNAYFRFQSELQKRYDFIPDNFDMEVFLKLSSTVRQGASCGNADVDQLMRRVLFDMPTVGDAQNKFTDDGLRANSFTFPQDHNLFTSTNAKSHSAENINTKFSPDGWTGAFTGEPDYFAPPPSTGRKVSPNRRTNATPNRLSRDPSRSATMDEPSTGTPREEGSYRPWGSDGTPKEVPAETASGEVRFSKEDWEKTFQDASWTWPPPPPRQASPTKSGAAAQSRKASQGRRSSKAANRSVTGTKQQPYVVEEDDIPDVPDVDGRPANGGPVGHDFDPMDIDNTPPGQQTTQNGAAIQGTEKDKEARLYSVPKSAWRQEQEQKQKQTHGHRKTSSASRRATRASVGDGAQLNANLDDLRNVEPLAKNTNGGAGFQNIGDMGSDLPWQSQAAPSANPKLLVPQHLDLPPVPTPPPVPTRLSKSSWHDYAQSFGEYLKAFHGFNNVMLRHFATRESLVEARFVNGTAWLEASGETSGMLSQPSGFGSYLAAVREDETVREAWNMGCEKHADAVKAFEKMRERVRKLAAQGSLVDT